MTRTSPRGQRPSRGRGRSLNQRSQPYINVGGAFVYDLPPNMNPNYAAYSQEPAFYPEGHQPPPDKFYKDVRQPMMPMANQQPMNGMMANSLGGPVFAHGQEPAFNPAGVPPNVQYHPQGMYQQQGPNFQQAPYHQQGPYPPQGPCYPQGSYPQGLYRTPSPFNQLALQGPPLDQGPSMGYHRGCEDNSMYQLAPSVPFGPNPRYNYQPGSQMASSSGYVPRQPPMTAQVLPLQIARQSAPQRAAPWQDVFDRIPGEIDRMQRELGVQFPPGLHYLPFVVVDRQQAHQGVTIENLNESRDQQHQQAEGSLNTAISTSANFPDIPTAQAVDRESVNTSNDYQDASDVWDMNDTERSCDLNMAFSYPNEASRLEKIPEECEASSSHNAKKLSSENSFHTPDSRRLAEHDVQNVSQESSIDHNNRSSSTQEEMAQEPKHNDSLMTDSSIEDYDDARDTLPPLPSNVPAQVVPYPKNFKPGDLSMIMEEASFLEHSRNSAGSRSSGSKTPTPQSINGSVLNSGEVDGQRTPTNKLTTCSGNTNQPVHHNTINQAVLPTQVDLESSVDYDTSMEVSFHVPTAVSTSSNTDAPMKTPPVSGPQTLVAHNTAVATGDPDSSVDWDTSIEASFNIPAASTTTEIQKNSAISTTSPKLETSLSRQVEHVPTANRSPLPTASSHSAKCQMMEGSSSERKEVKKDSSFVAKMPVDEWITVGSKKKNSVKHSFDIPTALAVDRENASSGVSHDEKAVIASSNTSSDKSAEPSSLALPSAIPTSSNKASQLPQFKSSKQKKAEKLKASKNKKNALESKKKEQDDADMEFLNSLPNTDRTDAMLEHKRAKLEDYCRRERIRRQDPALNPTTDKLILQKRVDDFMKKHSVLSKNQKEQARKFLHMRLAHHEKNPARSSEIAVPLYKVLVDCSDQVVLVDVLCLRTAYTPFIEMGWLCEAFSEAGLLEQVMDESPKFCHDSLNKLIETYISRTRLIRSKKEYNGRMRFFEELMTRAYFCMSEKHTDKEERKKHYPANFFEVKCYELLAVDNLTGSQRATLQLCIALSEFKDDVLEDDKFILHTHHSSIFFKDYLNNVFCTLEIRQVFY